MGQQCTSNNSADSYQLGYKRLQGFKIVSNNSKVYTPSQFESHFEKAHLSQNPLSPNVQRIHKELGNFHHSPDYIPPKGQVKEESFTLNEQGLIYKQYGEWLNNMPHGRGQLIYPDGSYYVGYLVNGIPHGQGRFISTDGWYYEGQLKNEQAEGKGKFYSYNDNFQYQGEWEGDLPNGHGKQICKGKHGERVTFEGNFLNGVKHGQGNYKSPLFTYSGRFQNNKKNGWGKLVYKNGQIYEGDFLNGKKHGHGVYRWTDGATFEGQYRDDLKHGFGKFTDHMGKIFQGQWLEGKRHGKGTVLNNSKKYPYEWRQNQLSPQKSPS